MRAFGTRIAWRSASSLASLGELVKQPTGSRAYGLRSRTKIVCTIGPVSESEEMLPRMVAAGMSCMRINCSHATFEEQRNRILRLKAAVDKQGKLKPTVPVPVLLDIKGPSIRTGLLDGPLLGKNKVEVQTGFKLTIRTDAKYDEYRGNSSEICVSYPDLHRELSVGDQVLIDDGVIELVVRSTSDGRVETEVVEGGLLGEKKGLNLPGVSTGVEFMTDKDRRDMEHAVGSLGVDFVAASFVRGPEVIRAFREFLDTYCGSRGKEVGIIAKIENEQGLLNYDEILHEVDGIMVARGDLGVEIPTEKLFLMQKLMIQRANENGRFVINCTQMLDSMIGNPRPTRAEALDVANAVLDGADANMLSGESAGGRFPEKAVITMRDINSEADAAFSSQIVSVPAAGRRGITSLQSTVAKKALLASVTNKVSLIIVLPRTEKDADAVATIAHELAQARPWSAASGPIAIMAVGGHGDDFVSGASPQQKAGRTFRQLAIRRNCWPVRPAGGRVTGFTPKAALQLARDVGILTKTDSAVACVVYPDSDIQIIKDTAPSYIRQE